MTATTTAPTILPELSLPELSLPEGGLSEGLSMPPELAAWVTSTPTVALLLVAALGAIYCFVGYRALRLILALLGFLLAGPVAALIVGIISGGNGLAAGIAFAVGGFCGAMALAFLYKSGVFLLGMLGGAALAASALPEPGETWHIAAVLGAGLAGGLLAVWIERPALRLATAALGALLMTHAAHALYVGGDLDSPARIASQPVLLGLWAALALMGLMAQFGSGRRRAVKR